MTDTHSFIHSFHPAYVLKILQATLLHADKYRDDILMSKDSSEQHIEAFDTYDNRAGENLFEHLKTVGRKSHCIVGNLTLHGCHKSEAKKERKTAETSFGFNSTLVKFFKTIEPENQPGGPEKEWILGIVKKYVANYY